MIGVHSVLESSRFRIDVADLLRRPGADKRLDLEDHVPGLEVGLGKVAEGRVHVSVRLEAVVEGILASGTAGGTWLLECSRCTVGFESAFEVAFHEVFAYPEAREGDDECQIEGEAIDLVPLLRDVVLLDMPTHPLHDPHCRGLCPACGQDRNVVDCGHDTTRKDARWEPLRRLRDQIGD